MDDINFIDDDFGFTEPPAPKRLKVGDILPLATTGSTAPRSARRACARADHRDRDGDDLTGWFGDLEAIVCRRCGTVVGVGR